MHCTFVRMCLCVSSDLEGRGTVVLHTENITYGFVQILHFKAKTLHIMGKEKGKEKTFIGIRRKYSFLVSIFFLPVLISAAQNPID